MIVATKSTGAVFQIAYLLLTYVLNTLYLECISVRTGDAAYSSRAQNGPRIDFATIHGDHYPCPEWCTTQ